MLLPAVLVAEILFWSWVDEDCKGKLKPAMLELGFTFEFGKVGTFSILFGESAKLLEFIGVGTGRSSKSGISI